MYVKKYSYIVCDSDVRVNLKVAANNTPRATALIVKHKWYRSAINDLNTRPKWRRRVVRRVKRAERRPRRLTIVWCAMWCVCKTHTHCNSYSVCSLAWANLFGDGNAECTWDGCVSPKTSAHTHAHLITIPSASAGTCALGTLINRTTSPKKKAAITTGTYRSAFVRYLYGSRR